MENLKIRKIKVTLYRTLITRQAVWSVMLDPIVCRMTGPVPNVHSQLETLSQMSTGSWDNPA